MAETSYIDYGKTQSNVTAELKVYYNVVTRTAANVTIDIDVGVHYPDSWSSNGCWVKVDGVSRSCNPNHVTGQRYWYASSQGNSRSAYWKRVTLSAAAANTSVSLPVGFSNTAYAAGTFQTKNFTLTIPIGNTNAYWSSPTCTVSPSGTIPENTNQLTVSWSGAKDDQGDTIYYDVEMWRNGTFTGNYAGGSKTTAKSGTVSISGDAPGTSYYFRTHCKDSASSSMVFGKQSATVTKNIFTAVSSFSITSPTKVIPGTTYSLSCTHNSPQNTNGNTSFTYGLSAAFVAPSGSAYALAVYGVTGARLAASPFSITIWDGTGSTPSGIYIKQADIRSACKAYAASSYTGSLRLTLTNSNSYGSSGSITASKELDWRFKPANPTAPTYTSDSYFLLPNSTDPMFIINRRAVTWTWGAVSDPNGTAVSYLVYTKTDNKSWVLSKTTKENSYTIAKKGIPQPQTYQIKVVARFAYGTTSDDSGSVGPQITLHNYNPPKVTASVAERSQTGVIIKATVSPSTSISDLSVSGTLTYSGLVSGTSEVKTSSPRSPFEEQKSFSGLEETTTGNVNLRYTDNLMTAILGPTASSTVVVNMTQWSALLTIREKGIGINAIAGDYADFAVKGTTKVYGGEAKGQADGSISFSTQASSSINFFSGIYVDDDGMYRAAQTIPPFTSVYQLQIVETGIVTPPLRWRSLLATEQTEKDAVFTPTIFSAWETIMDANFHDGNYNTVSINLMRSLQSYFLPNNFTDGLWRNRDCGYWSDSGGTGQLLVPVGTSQTASDYGQIELSLMWYNSNYAQKIWCSWYSSGSSHLVNGTYLSSIPDSTVKLVWNSSQSLKYLCIGSTGTSWSSLRMVNVDLYLSRSPSYKPTTMNPLITSASYTTLGSTGNLTHA